MEISKDTIQNNPHFPYITLQPWISIPIFPSISAWLVQFRIRTEPALVKFEMGMIAKHAMKYEITRIGLEKTD